MAGEKTDFSFRIRAQDTQSYQTLSPLPKTYIRNKFVIFHTQGYQSLASLPNNDRSKYVVIDSQSYQTLSSLPKTYSVFIDTHSYQTLVYALYRAMVIQIVRKQSQYLTDFI